MPANRKIPPKTLDSEASAMPNANPSSAAPTTEAAGMSPALKATLKPMNSRITVSVHIIRIPPFPLWMQELNESRTELLNRIQGLKQDVQNWRSKLDTQVNICRNELAELKKSLNDEADQLRSEFQDLRTTLQQQEDDVAGGLKNLELQDTSKEPPVPLNKEVKKGSSKDDDVQANEEEDDKDEEDQAEESEEEENDDA